MKKTVLLILSLFAAINLVAQDMPEATLALFRKADSLYAASDYKNSARTYSQAIRENNGKATLNVLYYVSHAWMQANYPDSAFNYLNRMATDLKFNYYSFIATSHDFMPLHNDNRWQQFLDLIKQNKKEMDEKWPPRCINTSGDDEVSNEKAAEVKSYRLNVAVDVKRRKVSVEGDVNIDFKGNDSIGLILWGKTAIGEIKQKGTPLAYTFYTDAKSPVIYIPDGRPLTIKNPGKITGMQPVYFSYECDMSNVTGWGRAFTDDWIEIGFYTGWFPVDNNSKDFTSKLRITIDEPYKINGSGVVKRKGNVWEMEHTWGIYDNVIIASKDLKTRQLKHGNITLETVYTTFPEKDIDSVLLEFKNVLEFNQQLYGAIGNTNASYKFVLCPTEGGGGYGRKNYISIKANSYDFSLGLGIAHELAHVWWGNTNATTWHNWIDEAYAEYTLLLYAKKKGGDALFDAYLDAYKVNASNSCPIWGIDRATPEAYTALYEKGSLILYELEQKVGNKPFLKFTKQILENRVVKTNDFLTVAEKEFGKTIRDWLEAKLKMTGYE